MLPHLPSVLLDWWSANMPRCTSPNATKTSDDLLYHIIELARNALNVSDYAFIIAGVHSREWTVVISDDGPGMDPQFALDNSFNKGFGFRNAFIFADTFIVEVFGRRYEKRRKKLLYTGEGTVTHGTRIILGKLFPAA
jgi:hypothetical protein